MFGTVASGVCDAEKLLQQYSNNNPAGKYKQMYLMTAELRETADRTRPKNRDRDRSQSPAKARSRSRSGRRRSRSHRRSSRRSKERRSPSRQKQEAPARRRSADRAHSRGSRPERQNGQREGKLANSDRHSPACHKSHSPPLPKESAAVRQDDRRADLSDSPARRAKLLPVTPHAALHRSRTVTRSSLSTVQVQIQVLDMVDNIADRIRTVLADKRDRIIVHLRWGSDDDSAAGKLVKDLGMCLQDNTKSWVRLACISLNLQLRTPRATEWLQQLLESLTQYYIPFTVDVLTAEGRQFSELRNLLCDGQTICTKIQFEQKLQNRSDNRKRTAELAPNLESPKLRSVISLAPASGHNAENGQNQQQRQPDHELPARLQERERDSDSDCESCPDSQARSESRKLLLSPPTPEGSLVPSAEHMRFHLVNECPEHMPNSHGTEETKLHMFQIFFRGRTLSPYTDTRASILGSTLGVTTSCGLGCILGMMGLDPPGCEKLSWGCRAAHELVNARSFLEGDLITQEMADHDFWLPVKGGLLGAGRAAKFRCPVVGCQEDTKMSPGALAKHLRQSHVAEEQKLGPDLVTNLGLARCGHCMKPWSKKGLAVHEAKCGQIIPEEPFVAPAPQLPALPPDLALLAHAVEEDNKASAQPCNICLDSVGQRDPLPCGHAFHPPCIQDWLSRQNTCPTCEAKIHEFNGLPVADRKQSVDHKYALNLDQQFLDGLPQEERAAAIIAEMAANPSVALGAVLAAMVARQRAGDPAPQPNAPPQREHGGDEEQQPEPQEDKQQEVKVREVKQQEPPAGDGPPALQRRVAAPQRQPRDASEIANPGYCYRRVPAESERLFIEVARDPLIRYVQNQDNEHEQDLALSDFMAIVGLTMRKPVGRKDPECARLVTNQLRALRDGAIDPIVQPPMEKGHSDQDTEDRRKILRAHNLIMQNHVRRAHNALINEKLRDTADPEVFRQMQALHPAKGKPLPALPEDAPVTIIDVSEDDDANKMRNIIRRMANGAAPGPSGYTAEMFVVLSHDTDCLRGLALICQNIINGALSDYSRYLLCGCIGLAAGKGKKPGIRPLVMPEVIVRVAVKYQLMATLIGALAELKKGHEFGIGVSGGVEIVAHLIQFVLDVPHLTPEEDCMAVSEDTENAYGTTDRAETMATLAKVPGYRPMLRVMYCLYGFDAPIWTRDAKGWNVARLFSCQGMRQGCQSGGFGHAVASGQIAQRTITAHKEVLAVKVCDDQIFAGLPTAVMAARQTNEEGLASINNTVVRSKEAIYHPSAHPLPQTVVQYATQHSLKVHKEAGPLLGTVIGTSTPAMDALLRKRLSEYDEYFRLILHPAMPCQDAFILLKESLSCVLQWLLRTVPPDRVQAPATTFHTKLLETAMKKLDIQASTDLSKRRVAQEMAMKLRDGGLGLDSGGFDLDGKATGAPAAYLSSLANAARFIVKFDLVPPPNSAIHKSAQAAIDILRGQLQKVFALQKDPTAKQRTSHATILNLVPEKLEEFFRFYANEGAAKAFELQHTFTKVLKRGAAKALREGKSAYQKARLNANAMKGSGRFLIARPSFKFNRLSNLEMKTEVNLRLGLLPRPDMKHLITCACGQNMTARNHNRHFLHCKLTKPQATAGHDEMGKQVVLFAKRAGATYCRWNHRQEDRKIPDAEMRTEEQKIVEFMITDSACKTNLPRVKQDPYGLTDYFEAKKADKYRALAAKAGATVVPFVVEAHGGPGKQAIAFIKELAALAKTTRSPWRPKKILNGLLDAIAVAVVRRNSAMITAGMALRGNAFAYNLA